MQATQECGKMRVDGDGFVRCQCGNKLTHITPETTGENIELFCRKCKRPHKVNIARGECFESHGP